MKQISKISIPTILVSLFFLFLPFERLLTFEIFGLTAKISFAILVLIIIYYLVVRPGPKLALEDKILFAFVGVSYLTAFWSIDQLRSLIIATVFLVTFSGFVALRRFITPALAERVKTILIFAGGALALFALWQYFADLYNLPFSYLRPEYTKTVFGFPRPQATFLEPLYFADFLFLPIFFTIERLLKSEKISPLLSANLFLIMLVFVLTLSRGAYIGFLAAALALSIIVALKYKQYLKRLGFVAAIASLGIIAGILVIFFTANRQSFTLFVDHAGVADVNTGESTLDRFYFARVAWQNTLHTPWGIGAGAFGALPDFSKKLEAGSYQTVGNLYLEVLVEEGVVGFLLFAAFVFLLIKHLWKNISDKKLESLISLIILLAILVQAISFSALYIIPIWAFFALVWRKAPYENTN